MMPLKAKSERTPKEQRELRKFQLRMGQRAFKHGKNWRQVFVDCGGMCLSCGEVASLEFHEPFGEDKFGWGIFQTRVLLCPTCHTAEHSDMFDDTRFIRASRLAEDVNIEILIEGGYNNWIKNHKLIDRFAWLLCQKGD